jgi:DNA-binding NtrC family response regulator
VRLGPNAPFVGPRLAGSAPPSAPAPTTGSLEAVEMEHILRVLQKHNGHKASAAAELGISLKTMYNKLNRYDEQRRAAAG